MKLLRGAIHNSTPAAGRIHLAIFPQNISGPAAVVQRQMADRLQEDSNSIKVAPWIVLNIDFGFFLWRRPIDFDWMVAADQMTVRPHWWSTVMRNAHEQTGLWA